MSGPGREPVPRRRVLGWLSATAALAVAGCGGDGDGRASGDEGGAPGAEVPAGSLDEEVAYGPGRHRRARLIVPAEASGGDPAPVIAMVPGGFWQADADPTLVDGLAVDAVARGWAVWRVEHSPVGVDGGGWPGTFVDVAAAVDHLAGLADEHPVDPDRVITLGHSSGAALALWAAARGGLPPEAPGAGPTVRPIAAVSLSGVTNLAAASIDGLGRGAVDDLMGVPATNDPDRRYLLASPIQRLPLGVPTLLVHGADDAIVPASQSRTFADRAREAGDDSEVEITGPVDHFAALDPGSDAWGVAVRWIGDRLG